MKHLTLLRHAKSSWSDTGLADIRRPLADRGRRDAPLMGRRLAAHGLRPDLLLTSPAKRAEQTADLIEPAFGAAPERLTDARLYHASPGEILSVLADTEDRFGDVIVVAHNPGLTLLANMMLPDLKLTNLPTSGAIAINCDTASWRTIDDARFSLNFHDTPKLARARGPGAP